MNKGPVSGCTITVMASNNGLELMNQLESGSIHSSDVREAQAQGDKSTSELRSRRKRKIKVSKIQAQQASLGL